MVLELKIQLSIIDNEKIKATWIFIYKRIFSFVIITLLKQLLDAVVGIVGLVVILGAMVVVGKVAMFGVVAIILIEEVVGLIVVVATEEDTQNIR